MKEDQEDAFERSRNIAFVNYIDHLKKEGYDERQIAVELAIPVYQLRVFKSYAVQQIKNHKIDIAQRLKSVGYTNVDIAKRMGVSLAEVKTLIRPTRKRVAKKET